MEARSIDLFGPLYGHRTVITVVTGFSQHEPSIGGNGAVPQVATATITQNPITAFPESTCQHAGVCGEAGQFAQAVRLERRPALLTHRHWVGGADYSAGQYAQEFVAAASKNTPTRRRGME